MNEKEDDPSWKSALKGTRTVSAKGSSGKERWCDRYWLETSAKTQAKTEVKIPEAECGKSGALTRVRWVEKNLRKDWPEG